MVENGIDADGGRLEAFEKSVGSKEDRAKAFAKVAADETRPQDIDNHADADDERSEARDKATAAHEASVRLAGTSSGVRDGALLAMADALEANEESILAANQTDVLAAWNRETPKPIVDRLLLDSDRLADMADSLRDIASFADPIGSVVEKRDLYNGIHLTKVRVPLGVIAMIYEARPNVTADAAGLCIKSGNACILRGGSLALNSNVAIANALSKAAYASGIPHDAIQYIEDTSHATTDELMQLHGLVDLLIPRGGKSLIDYCVANSKVPVIETGVGNCHIYLHEKADVDKAVPICVNAKTQRPGVCNAAESLLVDRDVAEKLLPPVMKALVEKGVTLHCDRRALAIANSCGIGDSCVQARIEDWGKEYLDLEMSVKCVTGIDEAIDHINRFGTKHSESIVSEDEKACERFLAEVDAACVYSNASTRFTDGGQFGLGAEIGISTQKIHVRGPMGLSALTSTKYVLRGSGQVRP